MAALFPVLALVTLAALCAVPPEHPGAAPATVGHGAPEGPPSAAHPAEEERGGPCDMTGTPLAVVAVTPAAAEALPAPTAFGPPPALAPAPPGRPPLFLVHAALLI